MEQAAVVILFLISVIIYLVWAIVLLAISALWRRFETKTKIDCDSGRDIAPKYDCEIDSEIDYGSGIDYSSDGDCDSDIYYNSDSDCDHGFDCGSDL